MSEHGQEFEITAATTTIKNDDIVNNNEPTKNQENHPEESIDFNLLRLDSASTTTYYHTPCSACGCSGSSSSSRILPATTKNNISFSSNNSNNKRRSPDPTALFLDPPPQDYQYSKKPKKLFLDTTIPSLRDFSKITLPSTSSFLGFGSPSNSAFSPPVLRRCHSDPLQPPVGHQLESLSNQTPQSPPESVQMAGETTATTPVSKATSASLPPRPPLLRRTVSEPSPDKSLSRSSSSSDYADPNYKLLKRMRDCIKEMSHWWDEYLPNLHHATGEEYGENKDTKDTNATKYEEDKGTEDTNATVQADLVTEIEEAVCVEKAGECLTINFKCPCSKGYKILLSGKDCYYKLM
eukprot:XP_015574055.1 uncharacterized protein LOC107261176 isoform X1 [Ricinus communis]